MGSGQRLAVETSGHCVAGRLVVAYVKLLERRCVVVPPRQQTKERQQIHTGKQDNQSGNTRIKRFSNEGCLLCSVAELS